MLTQSTVQLQSLTADTIAPPCSNTERINWVRERCKNRNFTSTKQLNRTQMPVNDKFAVIYCYIPKVACTTFKIIMMASASGKPLSNFLGMLEKKRWKGMRAIHSVRYLEQLQRQEQQRKLQTYYKFLIVRHPFDSVLSYYADKVNGKSLPLHQEIYGRELIMPHYDKNYTDPDARVTQDQFLEIVALNPDFQVTHLSPYVNGCHPCDVDYDAVLRLETLDRDLPQILPLLPGPDGDPYRMPRDNPSQSVNLDSRMSKVNRAFASLDRDT